MLSAKTDRGREASRRSQLIVEDPAAYVQQLKRRLQCKEGLPESQHRLIFRVPQQSGASEESAVAQPAAEEVLGELSQWQAIVFQNGKAIGRLLSPQLSTSESHNEVKTWCSSPDSSTANRFGEGGVVVETISVQYDQWQPTWAKASGSLKQLYLPVDSDFSASSYRIQVIGRSGGRPFAIPFAYTFSGKRVAAAVSLEVQRSEYIQRHQVQRGSLPELSKLDKSDIAVECGRGLEGFTTVFDAVDQPAWLKCVVLRFAVIARGVFDDVLPQGAKLPMSVQEDTASRSPGSAAKPQKAGQPEAPGPSQRAPHQAVMDSWLPKMPAPGSSKKPKAKRKANRGGGVEHPDQATGTDPEHAEEPHAGAAPYLSTQPAAQLSASQNKPAKVGNTEHKMKQGRSRGSSEQLDELSEAHHKHAEEPEQAAQHHKPRQLPGSAGAEAKEPEPHSKRKTDRSGGTAEGAMRMDQPRAPKASIRMTGPHHQEAASGGTTAQKKHVPKPTVALVPTGISAGAIPTMPADGEKGSKRVQKAEVRRKGRREVSSADALQAVEDTSSTADHALHCAGGSQTGSGSSTKQAWTQSSAGSGNGDGGGSSDEEDDRDGDADKQRGTGGGQGGDDGDHSRRWRRMRDDVEEVGKEGEEEAAADEDLSEDSLKTAVSDTPVPSGSEDSRSAVPMPRVPQGVGLESSSADTIFDSLESEKGMSEGEELGIAAAVASEEAKRPATQPQRVYEPPLGAVAKSVRREAEHPAGPPLNYGSAAGKSYPVTMQPPDATVPANSPLAAILAQSASGYLPGVRGANGSVPVTIREKSVPVLANGLPSLKATKPSPSFQQPAAPVRVVGTPMLASSSLQAAQLEGSPRWAPAATRPAPPQPAMLAQPMGAVMPQMAPVVPDPVNLLLPSVGEGSIPNGIPGPLPVTGIPAVPLAPLEGVLGISPNAGPVLLPNGSVQMTRQRSLSEPAPANADWITRSYMPATTTWTPNPGIRQGPLPADTWLQQEQHHPRPQPRPAAPQPRAGAQLRPAGPQTAQTPKGPAMANGYSREAQPQLYLENFGDVRPSAWSTLDDPAFAPPTRPFSATGHRPGLMMEALRLYDPAVDSGTFLMAVQDPPHTPNRSAVASPSFDPYMGSGMGPPPPPPPREDYGGSARELGGFRDEAEEAAIERQGSFQVPAPPHQASFEHNGPPVNDLEQLMSRFTPVLEPCAGSEGWTLADVWQFYEEASSYGKEVYTRSGRRGAALAYYWPMLSAVRLLGPALEPDSEEAVPAGAEIAMPLMDFFETEPPFLREPLCERVAHLSSRPHVKGAFPPEGLRNLRLDDLHPASWYAVAWYPVYRIPDAPLTAKFLTYHSLRPVSVRRTLFGALDEALPQQQESEAAASSPQCIPIIGFKCAERKSERWLESYDQRATREWEVRLEQLGVAADQLTRSKGLLLPAPDGGWEERHIYHSDQEWFNKHP